MPCSSQKMQPLVFARTRRSFMTCKQNCATALFTLPESHVNLDRIQAVLLTLPMKYYFYRQCSTTSFSHPFDLALINPNKKKFLKTIRYELISTPAYLERIKGKHILYLVRSLKTRQSFLSIWEKSKDFSLPYDTEKS